MRRRRDSPEARRETEQAQGNNEGQGGEVALPGEGGKRSGARKCQQLSSP